MMVPFTLFRALIYTLLVFAIINAVQTRKRNGRRRRPVTKTSSSEESESTSWEIAGNDRDRSIGFGSGGTIGQLEYGFYVTPNPAWTAAPIVFQRLKDVDDEMDKHDADYYANYDFEFAKSAAANANFNQKYHYNQEQTIVKRKQGITEGTEPAECVTEIPTTTTNFRVSY